MYKIDDIKKFPKETGVYKIYFNDCDTNKIYVGSASGEQGFYSRWKKHISDLKNNKKLSPILQKAFNKHFNGDNLIFEILELCDKDNCLITEQYYIDKLNTYKNGYNARPLASNNGGVKMKDSTRKIIFDKFKIKRDLLSNDVKELYESGKTTREICDILNISRNFLRRIFNENDIIPRKESGLKKRKVYQYKNNILLNEYESINECGRELNSNGRNSHGIDLVLKGKCIHYKGFYFSSNKLEPNEIENILYNFKIKSKNIKYRNIIQVSLDGFLIKEWDNVNDIINYLNIKNIN